MISAASSGSGVKQYANDGLGSFSEVTDSNTNLITVFSDQWGKMAAVDFTNDGKPELLVCGYSGTFGSGTNSLQLLVNDGTGKWSVGSVPNNNINCATYHEFMIGDVDGKNGLDILAEDGKISINDGSGSFSQLNTGVSDPYILADLDADGDLDIVASNGDIYLNTITSNTPSFSVCSTCGAVQSTNPSNRQFGFPAQVNGRTM